MMLVMMMNNYSLTEIGHGYEYFESLLEFTGLKRLYAMTSRVAEFPWLHITEIDVTGADYIGHGGIVSRRTANKKLTKLYTDHHESAHQND